MSMNDTSLFELARKVHRAPPHQAAEARKTLEDSVRPMIRFALRTGQGHAVVVGWVRRNAPPIDWNADTAPELSQVARPLAREFCEYLIEELDPLSCRETAIGA